MPATRTVELTFASTAIVRAMYHREARQLEIEYTTGGTYIYHDVPYRVVDRLRRAKSAGKFVNRVIKPTYSYTEK
jgi:KTSC domain